MDPIPVEVRQFLDANFESLVQLEILRVLGERPEKEWTPAKLALEVQTEPTLCAAHIGSLASRGLITSSIRGAESVCRYGARTPELESKLRRLLESYRERPVTMIKLVYARGSEPLRAFADSFRIRKES